jgi:hypothetical protein
MNSRIIMLLVALQSLSLQAFAIDTADILWLSDTGPKRAKRAEAAAPVAGQQPAMKQKDNMDAVVGGNEGDNLHSGTKRVWVRRGSDPLGAAYVSATEMSNDINLVDAKGRHTSVAQTPDNGAAHARCEFEELGFRNAYLTRETLKDGVLRVQLAKAELLKGNCCLKDADVDPDQRTAISDPGQPLEIVREHKADEKLFTRIVSGDVIPFTVLRNGKPLADAKVTIVTQQGWQKSAKTDAGGHVQFTMIRDYFPNWSEFRRLTKETFVVVAEAEATETGSRLGQPYKKVVYQATLSGKYAVSPYDYKSYAWGLGAALFVFFFGGLAVYLYRRRRVKPFREIRFKEEKAAHESA